MLKKIIITFILLLNCYLYSNTKTISLDFELSETAINRALVSQFNDPNFIFQHFTGKFEFSPALTTSYDVQLQRPTIEIRNNGIGIHLAFDVSLPDLGYHYSLNITPSIIMNKSCIMASEVVAIIENLDDEIDEWEDIPESVRLLLKTLYAEYKPEIYVGKLYNNILDELNSNSFIQQRAFSISDFGISLAFVENKLVLKVLVEITYGNTEFSCYVDQSNHLIKFGSNIKCKVRRVTMWTDLGYTEFYHNDNLNIQMTNNPDYDFNYFAQLYPGTFASQGLYTVYALFETNETFYYNKFVLHPDTWESPAAVINH